MIRITMGMSQWPALGRFNKMWARLSRRMAIWRGWNSRLQVSAMWSSDNAPWNHPYLTAANLARFRAYSEGVWEFAVEYSRRHPRPLRCAFAVNMAQNMYQWARLAQKYGAEVTLFPDIEHKSVLSYPEWEEFDGSLPDIYDGDQFLREHPTLQPKVPCFRVPRDGEELAAACREFDADNPKPLLQLLARTPGLRQEILLAYPGYYPFYAWSKALSEFEVIYIANMPFPAYASGKPYCALATGGDVRLACGRGDLLGRVLSLSFNAARFLMISNPHVIAHSRRLGFTNGVYLPFPVDDSRYSPGTGQTRREWEARCGRGIYVLTVARLDSELKGYDSTLFEALMSVARARQEVRFVFMSWGEDVPKLTGQVASSGLGQRVLMLKPAGKQKLIDYYRSCDLVLDQLVYGYYGATALEAASIGKPVIMKLRGEQYVPLYKGDVAPVFNAGSPTEVCDLLLRLVDCEEERIRAGIEMRNWLVRTHGEKVTMPLLLALLRLTADQVPLPPELVNPLRDVETEAERDYHAACRRPLE